jgi:hypothetical protein
LSQRDAFFGGSQSNDPSRASLKKILSAAKAPPVFPARQFRR